MSAPNDVKDEARKECVIDDPWDGDIQENKFVNARKYRGVSITIISRINDYRENSEVEPHESESNINFK